MLLRDEIERSTEKAYSDNTKLYNQFLLFVGGCIVLLVIALIV